MTGEVYIVITGEVYIVMTGEVYLALVCILINAMH